MRNQDPLNPADTTQFATQLATFSSLEQQVLTNNLLEKLVGAGVSGNQSVFEAAGLLGQEARVTGATTYLGTPIELSIDANETAVSASLIVENAFGTEVQSLPIDPSQTSLIWSGTDETGANLSIGQYKFFMDTVSEDGSTHRQKVAHYSKITELRPGANGTDVLLENGMSVSSDQVVGLRSSSAISG
jgi:flagellar basal-body rod modification protein FlgD